jgi:hypothetical protein
VTEETRVIFRSESAKYFIFLHLSPDLLAFSADGQLFLDKAVYGFFPDLFARWKAIGANHVVSIVLSTRVLYTDQEYESHELEHDSAVLRGWNGLGWYKDFYRVVIDWETRYDWQAVVPAIKSETIAFYRSVLERQVPLDFTPPLLDQKTVASPLHSDGRFHVALQERFNQMPFDGKRSYLVGRLAPASHGNLLESINLALNIFTKHYIDRDLLRTGLSIVFITPSPFVMAHKNLVRLTMERMVEDGVGLFWSFGAPYY